MTAKPTAKQLAADLQIAQLALRNIVEMLGQTGMHTDNNPLETNVYYNVGRARGTAQQGLSESGHGTRNPKALNYVERSNLAAYDFTLPLASVTYYSPNGTPTTSVNCFNVGAILYAVEHANAADSIRVSAYRQ